jgi:hypothetical protein
MSDYIFTLPNATSGMDAIGIQLVSAVPGFIPMMLLFVFLVVLIGGITRQKARSGTADYPMWFTVGALSSFLVSLLLSVSSGFLRLEWLVISFAFLVVCGIWFFMSEKGHGL